MIGVTNLPLRSEQSGAGEKRGTKRKTTASDTKIRQIAKKAKAANETFVPKKKKYSTIPVAIDKKIKLLEIVITQKCTWKEAGEKIGISCPKAHSVWSNLKKTLHQRNIPISLQKALEFLKNPAEEKRKFQQPDYKKISLEARFEMVHRKINLGETTSAIAKKMGFKYEKVNGFLQNQYGKATALWKKRFQEANLDFDTVVKAREEGSIQPKEKKKEIEKEPEKEQRENSGNDVEKTVQEKEKHKSYPLRSRKPVNYKENSDSEEDSDVAGAGAGAGAKVVQKVFQNEVEENSDVEMTPAKEDPEEVQSEPEDEEERPAKVQNLGGKISFGEWQKKQKHFHLRSQKSENDNGTSNLEGESVVAGAGSGAGAKVVQNDFQNEFEDDLDAEMTPAEDTEEVQSEPEAEEPIEDLPFKQELLPLGRKIQLVKYFRLLGKNWITIAIKMKMSADSVQAFYSEYLLMKNTWDKLVTISEQKNANTDTAGQ